MPKVSFIMPVYNGENLVKDAIDSVLDQTFDSFELIIINDGSTDDSASVIKQYLPHDSIRYVEQENQGVTETTNRGIKLAEGDYLSIHPQDDISRPERLETQVPILEDHPDIGLVYTPAEFVDRQGNVLSVWGDWREEGRVPKRDLFYELYVNGMFLASPAVLFRTDHITDDANPWGDPELQIVSDWEHWLQATQWYDAFEISTPLIAMLRDESHDYLSSRKEQVFKEEKIVIRRTRERFFDGDPPVTRRTYARAMSNHHVRELRYNLTEKNDYYGTLSSTFKALAYNPINSGVPREFAFQLRDWFR